MHAIRLMLLLGTLLSLSCSASHAGAPDASAPDASAPASARTTRWTAPDTDSFGELRPAFVAASPDSFRVTLDHAHVRVTAADLEVNVPGSGIGRLVLQRSTLSRHEWTSSESPPTLAVDGSLWRGAESIRPGAGDTLEQRWTFEAAPPGDGDLVVRIPAPGAELLRVDEVGLHLLPPEGSITWVYGHATWIDADGREVPIRAHFDAGSVVLRVSEALLHESRYPAVLDPVIGPDVPADPALHPGLTTVTTSDPDVAWDGTQHFVVWDDFSTDESPSRGTVRGSRVSASGVVLDGVGLVLAQGGGSAVASSGSQFLVTYSDGRELYVTRVSSTGTVLDSPGVSIGDYPRTPPRIAYGDGVYLVVWQMNARHVLAARVDTSGAVLDSPAIRLDLARGSPPAVAFCGGRFVVSWAAFDSRNSVQAIGITPAGIVDVSPVTLSLDADPIQRPGLACNGAELLEVVGLEGGWMDAIRMAPDLTVIDTASRFGNIASGSDVGWDGTRWIVSHGWVTGSHRTTTLDTSSVPMVIGTPVLLPHTVEYAEMALSSGASPLLSVFRKDGPQAGIWASRIDAAGGAVDAPPIPLSRGSNQQTLVHVASNGTSFLVVWVDVRVGEANVVAVRVASDGTILDPTPFRIAPTPLPIPWGAIRAVLGHGSEFLVILPSTAGSTEMHRVSAGGSLLGSPIEIELPGGGMTIADFASDGSQLLVVGQLRTYPRDKAAYRVDMSGTILDGLIRLASNARTLHAIGTPGMFYVSHASTGHALGVYRISSAGVLLDATPIAAVRSSLLDRQSAHALATDGTDLTIAWHERARGPALFAAQVSRAGVVSPPTGFAVDPRDETDALQLDHDGVEFVASYRIFLEDTYATWFQPDGTVEAGSPHSYLTNGGHGVPVIATTTSGQTLFAYTATEAGMVRNSRVRLRLASRGPPLGTACAAGAECASGFCVDGVCCDAECGAGAHDCQVCSVVAGASVDGTCQPLGAATECRPSEGLCDAAELCDGTSPECPANAAVPDRTECGDGLVCNGDEACIAGVCSAGTALSCDDGDACTADLCSEGGGCASTPIAGCCIEDDTCDDGSECTVGRCIDNACAFEPLAGCCASDTDCEDRNACTDDVCDVATGICSRTDVATCCESDSACDDGDPCTADRCGADGACGYSAVPGCEEAPPPADGCGCRVASRPEMPWWPAGMLLAALRIRRRRAPRRRRLMGSDAETRNR